MHTQYRLLRIKDVAEQLNLSSSYIYKLVEANRIPHVRFGNRIRFVPEEIDGYVAEKSQAQQAKPVIPMYGLRSLVHLP